MAADTHKQDTFLTIHNSGSTNFPGYTITINDAGSGTLVYEECRYAPERPQCQKEDKTFPLQTFQLSPIRQLLSQIGSIQNIPGHSCIKSISMGSTTNMFYQGQKSGDISCINSSDPPLYQNLKKEVDALIAQATRSS
ncbi:hypothetical protein [Dictyobacter aurantiacus]|uniref:Uncharacterized protein n=1 Tax=Dictyobacter aurantiacus TaxID=1936993 RepID=A0A401ZMK8_9CHLR|nr:hypothetical protein [Dictyobacter aurantiacus]GCE08099.1 hypothetical protein KDAU_54280 [Dictyobacter aurantiacus]